MKVITIPNFYKYQHYADRNIIWVKVHVDIIHDYKYRQLKDTEKALFIGLICLAAQNHNEIPADFPYISRLLCDNSRGFNRKVLKLMDLKLIAIKRIARRKQDACLDKDKEKNRKDKETDDPSFNFLYKKGDYEKDKDALIRKMGVDMTND